MCRWIAYSGSPIYLVDLIYRPIHSLIDQSLSAHSTISTTNGDGFGIGWYGDKKIPGIYKSIRPAWNDPNLKNVADQIKSHLFFAHVRAATLGSVQHTNCHPFRYKKWLFQHNGLIRHFNKLKRDLIMAVSPELYPKIEGSTDSELIFFLALTFGLENNPIQAIEQTVQFIEQIALAKNIHYPVQMTLAISDGRLLYGFRYSSVGRSRSLYYNESTKSLSELYARGRLFAENAIAIVSEPLGGLSEGWIPVPESTVIVIDGGRVEQLRFNPH